VLGQKWTWDLGRGSGDGSPPQAKFFRGIFLLLGMKNMIFNKKVGSWDASQVNSWDVSHAGLQLERVSSRFAVGTRPKFVYSWDASQAGLDTSQVGL